MKTNIFLFKPWGYDLVMQGRKNQTCRPHRKREAVPGELMQARRWSGLPYSSKVIIGATSPITNVFSIRINLIERLVHSCDINSNTRGRLDENVFALADGFENTDEFFGFFEKQYFSEVKQNAGLWIGVCTCWKPILYPSSDDYKDCMSLVSRGYRTNGGSNAATCGDTCFRITTKGRNAG